MNSYRRRMLAAGARLNINKIVWYAVIINIVEIAAALLLIALALVRKESYIPERVELFFLITMTLIVASSAFIDIREALSSRRVFEETDMLEDANTKLNELNDTLRAQRHDFMNHLQVVYSLIEMDEKADALHYIDQVYSDIQRVGRALKTAIPAVNALLAAKSSDCEQRAIRFELDVRSAWADMPASGWALCRVLGNLIDNAIEALKDTPSPHLLIELSETPEAYTFAVENNGPAIKAEHVTKIFHSGFTTKGVGHGMGLAIVSDILREHGGHIGVASSGSSTRFEGSVPK